RLTEPLSSALVDKVCFQYRKPLGFGIHPRYVSSAFRKCSCEVEPKHGHRVSTTGLAASKHDSRTVKLAVAKTATGESRQWFPLTREWAFHHRKHLSRNRRIPLKGRTVAISQQDARPAAGNYLCGNTKRTYAQGCSRS